MRGVLGPREACFLGVNSPPGAVEELSLLGPSSQGFAGEVVSGGPQKTLFSFFIGVISTFFLVFSLL